MKRQIYRNINIYKYTDVFLSNKLYNNGLLTLNNHWFLNNFFIINKSVMYVRVIDMDWPTVSCNFNASKNYEIFAGQFLIRKKSSESGVSP